MNLDEISWNSHCGLSELPGASKFNDVSEYFSDAAFDVLGISSRTSQTPLRSLRECN